MGPKWAQIRKQYMPSRSVKDIMYRWKSIQASHMATDRNWWSADEDEQLQNLVAEHGKDWVAVATCMQNRDRAQCRQRWNSKLRQQLNNSDWTPREDQEIWT